MNKIGWPRRAGETSGLGSPSASRQFLSGGTGALEKMTSTIVPAKRTVQ